MKLSIVIPVLNQYDLLAQTIKFLAQNSVTQPQLLLIDNGSNEEDKKLVDAIFDNLAKICNVPDLMSNFSEFRIIEQEKNIGTYRTFQDSLQYTKGDIVSYLHTDLFIYEQGWDKRVLDSFEQNTKLGLIGFIGSNEIDNFGGRGIGTMSNFQGSGVGGWNGSPAEAHGRRITNINNGAVVDGCAMIFRKDCLQKLESKPNMPLHHFYDRLFSCQILEGGNEVAVLGIACDHISGQTVNKEVIHHFVANQDMLNRFGSKEKWIELRKEWINNTMNPSRGKKPDNPDYWTYLEAEWQFLNEYRDVKHFIPIRR